MLQAGGYVYVLSSFPHTVTSKPLDKPSDEFEDMLGESVCFHNVALSNTTSLLNMHCYMACLYYKLLIMEGVRCMVLLGDAC